MTIKNFFHLINSKINFLIIIVIFIFALLLRTIGYNWDQGQHLHPDERFLTMVASDIKLPSSISQYFDTANSPLNPYNYPQYQFFVYGTFPLFLTKFIAEFLKMGSYEKIYLVGRILSAIFDSLNIIILYLLTKNLIKTKKKLLLFLPSFLYATTVLPLQLSHFFTVDTFLNTFILLTFSLFVYFYKNENIYYLSLASISYGLALSSKISAIYFLPIIGIFFILKLINSKKIIKTIKIGLLFFIIALITYRIFQPYAFTGLTKINPLLIENYKSLKEMGSPNTVFPPSVQWLSKTRIIFPLQNIVLFGLGLPLSISIIFLSIRFFIRNKLNFKIILKSSNIFVLIIVFWILFLFIYQGFQFAHPMRYFLVIYPFILIIFSILTNNLKISYRFIYIILFFHFICGFSYLTIYFHPHSRVESSNWIYKNISINSNIRNEYWDDALPLSTPVYNYLNYNNENLPLYDPDTPQKWQKLNISINESDYLILSSNRLWASIPKAPLKYPITSKYYKDLFNEKLEFKLIKKIVSYPGFNLPIKKCIYLGPTNYPDGSKFNNWFEIDNYCSTPGIYFRDDIADESFTVYDHPQVLIFKNTKSF